VPDLTPKLLRAVVEIGTQLRRIADAQTTPVVEVAEVQPTTSDDTRHATLAAAVAAALTAEHYRRAEARIVASPEEHCAAMTHAVMRVLSPVDTTADAPTTTPDDGPRCVCGDPIELRGDPGYWIHSPGSDTPCLNPRPNLPDNGRRLTHWMTISPELAAQRAETMNMLERYIDSRTCPTPETHNWGCGCPTDEAPAAHTKTLRWARRESLLVLLTRVQHGRTLTDDEARTLRHHVETEMREAETARERAERAEEQRDKLTTLVRDIFASFNTIRSDGKTVGYQGPYMAPDQFEDWYDRAHDPASDQPATEERSAVVEQCRAVHPGSDPIRRCIRPARHTEDHAADDGWHWLEDIAVYPAAEEQQS
jgi:hypothetical protein